MADDEQPINFIDNVFPYTFPCSGNVTFTGPEGLRDYRPHTVDDVRPVGIGEVSSEQTMDTSYLLRPAPGTPMEKPRCCYPGEIGWGIPWLMDWATPRSGKQIVLGDFRQAAQDRTTHQYMGAWYPGPKECTPPGSHGYYRENIFSGRPGTSNVRHSSALSPWRPTRSSHSARHAYRGHQQLDDPNTLSSEESSEVR